MTGKATGDIEATGINPQADFKTAASGIVAAPKPYTTFVVRPEKVADIVSTLDDLKGRTNDADITKEQTGDGTKYSFIDKHDNQPLAVMKPQNGQTVLTIYKSPEDLAKRIDSNFVTTKDINDFIKTYSVEPPSAQTNTSPKS